MKFMQKGHMGKEALGVTGVPQVSPPQLAGPCWREPLSNVQQTRKMHHPWIAGVLESKSQSFVCLPRALFSLLSERYRLLCSEQEGKALSKEAPLGTGTDVIFVALHQHQVSASPGERLTTVLQSTWCQQHF